MRTISFADAQSRYDSMLPPDHSREDAMIDELWPEEAGKYAVERIEYILDDERTAALFKRIAETAASHKSDEVLRGYGSEVVELIRAWCAERERDINERCLTRGAEYARNRE